MGVVVAILLLALLFGGIGFAVEGMTWLLIIAVILFIFGGFRGYSSRSR